MDEGPTDREASRRHFLLASAGMVMVPAFASAPSPWPPIDAPNFVAIDPLLATSGQPSAAVLGGLQGLGVEAVISLAPRGGPDLVPGEAAIVRGQGLAFVPLPFPPDGPSAAQSRAVAAALKALPGKRTLVHCQVNWQASVFVFLYRVIDRQEDPRLAYEAVASVWSPPGPWMALLVAELRAHAIDFEPY
jgi:protein tyrosine phosphatase (PTP) superfamily phosphohydrolase (DUF442 family)